MRIYPELHDDIKKLYGKFGQSEVDQETVAQLLGHKSGRSSTYRVYKLGSLRSYGLIEGRGKIRVTDLGKRLTYPENDEEYVKAIVEAVRNIPLWKIFFDDFTSQFHFGNFCCLSEFDSFITLFNTLFKNACKIVEV